MPTFPLPINQAANQPSERQRGGGGLKSSLSSLLPTSGRCPALSLLLLTWLFQKSNQLTLTHTRHLFRIFTHTRISLCTKRNITLIKSFVTSASFQRGTAIPWRESGNGHLWGRRSGICRHSRTAKGLQSRREMLKRRRGGCCCPE